MVILAGSFMTAASIMANTPVGDPALLIVPAFERPAISRYLPGSKRTIVTPAYVTSSGVITPLQVQDFKTPEEWDRFVKSAQERSSLRLATITPTLIRDEHGVIQMAAISTDAPTTGSLILTPEFLHHFSAIFGPELLILIPAKDKICVFPKLANHLPEMTPAIRDDYLISPMPASTEIFELTSHGLHAVGSINPDDD
jgi:hypothetical protein